MLLTAKHRGADPSFTIAAGTRIIFLMRSVQGRRPEFNAASAEGRVSGLIIGALRCQSRLKEHG